MMNYMQLHQKNKKYVVRLRKRVSNKEMLNAEVEWVNYLHVNGVKVHQQVKSLQGHFVEELDNNIFCTATVMAEGGWTIGERLKFWDTPLFEELGQMSGKMHTLSAKYSGLPRKHLLEEDFLDASVLSTDKSHDWTLLLQRHSELISWLKSLPKTSSCYGIIHGDINRGNFFVDDNGSMTLFDFDDCCTAWYGYDIASTIYYAVLDSSNGIYLEPMSKEYTENFVNHFLKGYQEEARDLVVDQKNTFQWLSPAIIDKFCQVRQMFLLLLHFKKGNYKSDDMKAWFYRTKESLEKNEFKL